MQNKALQAKERTFLRSMQGAESALKKLHLPLRKETGKNLRAFYGPGCYPKLPALPCSSKRAHAVFLPIECILSLGHIVRPCCVSALGTHMVRLP